MAVGSLAVLAISILLGVLEPVLRTHEPSFVSLQHIHAPAGTEGWPLGGDGSGRDIWAMFLASVKVSLLSAAIGTGVAVIVGGTFGLIAGYFRKSTDTVASYVFDLLMALPTVIMLVVLSPLTGGGYAITMTILGLLLAPGVFRLVRNLVVAVRDELYVDAARVSGLSAMRIISRHIFYVVRGPIVIQAAFLATACIGLQAGLAFIGIGADIPSFGTMTSQAFANVYSYPMQLLWPTIGLTLLTGACILFGNAYRDALAGSRRSRRRPSPRPGTAKTMTSRVTEVPNGRDAASSDVLLRVRDLVVAYAGDDGTEKEVVHGVSLDVRPGEIVGLVGESGSGKTQTAFSILGLLPGDASVHASELSLEGHTLLGRNLSGVRGRDIAYIPQEPMSNLDPSFTVGSQLVEGLRQTMPRAEAKKVILELLSRVGLPDPVRTFNSYPHQISGGMAQRVLIAGAVASRPKLLIADEPTTALDVTVQADILDLLRELQRELGMAVLLVTHNFGVVADLCERVVVMRAGQVVETGAVHDIFHNPHHPYTRELIGAILDENAVRTDVPETALGGSR
ncbi:dipeptide/oligopeptide/nickel ABC transporter permease/ATP-binding protein [Pseudarthrobacter sp. R1]|uniref:dipeptide/oligopeptide/nickel ABC transporter permease/ATP-binding protein n=1 Tax=Pseudarthrobacter sp. R1 TaxID=2944934 RepID=UPI00210A390D|nr:dipeptide/oligopeptide/nickel ABC transporter permease/ATP-binding protein [Pseudarthrobacter sp. R1]MCQ6272302.1 dipeptide/oligopeptide/nickel ABC transporter permease/ATP-binding protein [Pseudarthrobacter sp. R1]